MGSDIVTGRKDTKKRTAKYVRVLEKGVSQYLKMEICEKDAFLGLIRTVAAPVVMPWWHNWGLKGADSFEVWESLGLRSLTKSECQMLGKEKREKELFPFLY